MDRQQDVIRRITAHVVAGMSIIDVDLAHRWQEFRIRCLELAVKVGATDETVIKIADKLGEYILTRSPREIGAENEPTESSDE